MKKSLVSESGINVYRVEAMMLGFVLRSEDVERIDY